MQLQREWGGTIKQDHGRVKAQPGSQFRVRLGRVVISRARARAKIGTPVSMAAHTHDCGTLALALT